MEKNASFGFGKNNPDYLEETDGYIGKFVSASQNGNNVYGVLKEIRCGYAYFNPSIIQYADNTLYVEEKLPSRLILPLTAIKPIKGSLEDYVKVYNHNLKNFQKK